MRAFTGGKVKGPSITVQKPDSKLKIYKIALYIHPEKFKKQQYSIKNEFITTNGIFMGGVRYITRLKTKNYTEKVQKTALFEAMMGLATIGVFMGVYGILPGSKLKRKVQKTAVFEQY